MHYMPAGVEKGVVLLPSLAGDPINWELGGHWRNAHAFQAIVRDFDIPCGSQRAVDVNKALTILQETTLPAMPELGIPSVVIRYIRPKHDVITYPRSPANYFEFSTNFEAVFSIEDQ